MLIETASEASVEPPAWADWGCSAPPTGPLPHPCRESAVGRAVPPRSHNGAEVDVTGRGNDGLIPIMKKISLSLLLSIAGLAAGCGGHNLFSAPVGVNLHAQSGDVSSGTITQDK